MAVTFDELLSAAIGRLEELQQRGDRFIPLGAEGLAALNALERGEPTSTAPRRPAVPPAPAKPPINPPRKAASESASLQLPAASTPAMPDLAEVPPLSTTEPLSPELKAAAMAELRERALVCVKCGHLARSRRSVVFGVGDANAQLMFVGEAPGMDEDAQGEPFVGKAGQLLTRIIQTMGLSRATVYIGNVLKCRPDTPGQSAGNRKPTADEMKTCLPYLNAQIDIIRPKAIVALGATAVEGLLGRSPVAITRLRGNWQEFRGIPLMPTFHPSYLLRNESLAVKRQVWEDMLQVMTRLGMPISEKQQNYFLKAG